MFVASEGLSNLLVAHDHERQTIRQRPLFVPPLLEKIHAALKEAGVGGNDFDAGMIEESAVERHKIGAVIRVAISVAKLGEHPFGDDEVELRVAGKFCCLQVAFFTGIQQREKIKPSAKTVVIFSVRPGDNGRG